MRLVFLCALASLCLGADTVDQADVKVYGTEEPIQKAFIDVYKDASSRQRVQIDHDSGYYALGLDYDHVYILEFESKGYIDKTLEIDTRGVIKAEHEGGFGMNVDMTLIDPKKAGVKRKTLKFLEKAFMGKAKYSVEELNFLWDMELTERMRERQNAVLDAAKKD